MKQKSYILIALILSIGFCIWYFSDLGLDYEEIKIYENSELTVRYKNVLQKDIEIKTGNDIVIHYLKGRHHSRVTTAHGFRESIYLQIKKDGFTYKVVKVARDSYPGNEWRVKSLEDVLMSINVYGNKCYFSGAIIITRFELNSNMYEDWTSGPIYIHGESTIK